MSRAKGPESFLCQALAFKPLRLRQTQLCQGQTMPLQTETPTICSRREERDGKCQGGGTGRERFSGKGKGSSAVRIGDVQREAWRKGEQELHLPINNEKEMGCQLLNHAGTSGSYNRNAFGHTEMRERLWEEWSFQSLDREVGVY